MGQTGFYLCHHIIGDLQTTSLKKREDIVIMKADKGNATVVMDKEQYDEKLKDILQPPTYKRINRDPTSKTVKRVTDTLKSLLVKHNITPTLFDKLKPRVCRTPRF